MFRSSMKTSSLFPTGGPYVSLVLFSTLASRFLCRSMEVVLDDKLMTRVVWKKEQEANHHRLEIPWDSN